MGKFLDYVLVSIRRRFLWFSWQCEKNQIWNGTMFGFFYICILILLGDHQRTVRLIHICMFLIICINNVLFSGKLSLFLGHRDIDSKPNPSVWILLENLISPRNGNMFYIFLLGCLCVLNPVSFCNLRQVNIYIYHHCYERCNYSRVRALGSPDRSLSDNGLQCWISSLYFLMFIWEKPRYIVILQLSCGYNVSTDWIIWWRAALVLKMKALPL